MSGTRLAPTDPIYPTVSQDALHVNNSLPREILRDDRWREEEGKECHILLDSATHPWVILNSAAYPWVRA